MNQMSAVCALPAYFFRVHFSIILPSMPASFQAVSFLLDFIPIPQTDVRSFPIVPRAPLISSSSVDNLVVSDKKQKSRHCTPYSFLQPPITSLIQVFPTPYSQTPSVCSRKSSQHGKQFILSIFILRIFINLYMFRATVYPSSGETTVFM